MALEYSRGHFHNAVNGFFPPLISWLMVPFIKLGMTPVFAFRALNLVTGLFILIGAKALSYKFNIADGIRNALLLALVPILLYYSTYLFPDMLALCFLVYYTVIIFDNKYPDRVKNGLLCGVLGSLAYFSKNYAFPFFVAHFLMLNALFFLRCKTAIEKKNVFRNAVVGLVVFFMVSGVWVYLISSKYGSFTFGTAGDYMSKLLGPEVRADYQFEDTQEDDPVYWAGLLKPSYETALSAWDDPSFMLNKFYPKTVKLTSDPKYLVQRMLKNTRIVIQTVFVKWFSFLSIPIIIAYILFCIQPLDKLLQRGDIIYPLATVVLFSAGLTPFVVNIDNVRYFWFDNILLLLMGGQVLSVLIRNEFFSGLRMSILIIFFVLSFIAGPLRNVIQKPARGEDNYALFEKLKAYNVQGNIASDDKWSDALQVAYHLKLDNDGTFFYGVPKKNQSGEALLHELKSHNIDYYLVYGESGLPGYKEITDGRIPGLKVFSMKEGEK
ncbi:MAG: hypothetical protein Q7U10_01465 [Thermodesulfovibrionia bacterium]|nr:hypothetical protein [Thermodesulfovibrionia bacterium]